MSTQPANRPGRLLDRRAAAVILVVLGLLVVGVIHGAAAVIASVRSLL